MSLSQWDILAGTVQAMRGFFTDIHQHLNHQNYRNGTWEPSYDGITLVGGSFTATGNFQRWGRTCVINIVLDGAHETENALINNLPETAIVRGVVYVASFSSGEVLGAAVIEENTKIINLPDYTDSGDAVVISGQYITVGI